MNTPVGYLQLLGSIAVASLEFADDSASDIFIRFSPVSGPNTIDEIQRLARPGTRITVLEAAGGGQGRILQEALGDSAEEVLKRAFESKTVAPGVDLEILKLLIRANP